ncbi:MAG TPA: Uma2 family endonuclease [Chthoniobacteraceae bacterium]|nr:Uma2 family endonuclease [Chthoniobacteraceae bacterium]
MNLLAERYKFTVDEFARLAESGIIESRDRIELLDGHLIMMHAPGYRHGQVVLNLNAVFSEQARRRYMVGLSLPVELDHYSAPEPDLTLVPYNFRRPSGRHPSPAEVHLLIEVSNTSLGYDRGDKKAAYAAVGIREFWIFDLQHDLLEIYREPEAGHYREFATVPLEGAASPLAFPDVVISLEQVTPPR